MSDQPPTFDRTWLDQAKADLTNGQPDHATASALIGLLTALADHDDQQSREDFLDQKWTEADNALGRVLELADDLDARAGSLKSAAFPDLAARIRAAIDGEDQS